jgi:drug/metabolite transporter (DMT)-like permease
LKDSINQPTRGDNLALGAALIILAGACFASMGALIKLASATLPNEMVVFLRNVFALLFLGPWLIRLGPSVLRTRCLHLHLLRACIGLTTMFCFFWAIPRLHLAEAVLLNYSQPLFIPFIAWLWLGEKPARVVYPAIVVGFVGVAMILKPSSGVVSIPGLVGLGAGVSAACAMTAIRRLSATEPTTRIVFYFTLFAATISAVGLIWGWKQPSWSALEYMAGAGGCAILGQMLMTKAYSLAPAARVGSFIYSAVVFAGVLGWLIWGETLDRYTLLGIGLVIVAGALAISQRRESETPE